MKIATPSTNGHSHNSNGHIETEKTIPESVYRKHVLRARSSNNTFIVQRDWALVMTNTDCFFLQDIVNRMSMKKAKTIEVVVNDELRQYVLCTVAYLERHPLRWNRKIQSRIFKRLQKLQFVHILHRGLPRRRYVWVDIVNIEKAVDSALSPSEPHLGFTESTPNGVHCPTPNGNSKNGTTNVVPRRIKKGISANPSGLAADTPSGFQSFSTNHQNKNGRCNGECVDKGLNVSAKIKKERNSVHDELARRVWNVAAKIKKVTPYGKIKSWSDRIFALEKKLTENGRERVTAAFEWYCKNATEKTEPIITCSKGINIKVFVWIESLMKKADKQEWDRSGSGMDRPTRIIRDPRMK